METGNEELPTLFYSTELHTRRVVAAERLFFFFLFFNSLFSEQHLSLFFCVTVNTGQLRSAARVAIIKAYRFLRRWNDIYALKVVKGGFISRPVRTPFSAAVEAVESFYNEAIRFGLDDQ